MISEKEGESLYDHPSPAELEGFVFNRIPPEEAHQLLVHILQGCSSCYQALAAHVREILNTSEEKALPQLSSQMEAEYDRFIDQVLGEIEGRMLADARSLLASADPERIDEVLAEAPAHIEGSFLIRAMIEKSQSLRYDNPREMVRLAQMAAVFAGSLPGHRFGEERVAHLRFLTLTEWANALRVADDLPAAQRIADKATDYLLQARDEPLKARFLIVQAGIYVATRQYDDAMDVLNVACVIYKRLGDEHLVGRTLLKMAICLGYSGDPEGAIRINRQGLATVDEEREPLLVASAFQSLSRWLSDAGRFREARLALWEVKKKSHLLAGRTNELKIRWLEGQISAGLKEYDRAERDLLYVKEGFAEEDLRYKEALAGMELGALRVRRGRHAEGEKDVLEAVAVFERLGISHEVKRAVRLLRLAFEERVATLAFIERVLLFLRRAEHDPGARF